MLFQSLLAIETRILLICIAKQPNVKGLPYTSLIGLSELVECNDGRVFIIDKDDEEEKLEPRGDAIDSESELQSSLANISKSIKSSLTLSWGFLVFPRFVLLFQNLSLERVEGFGWSMHGLGSPMLRSAGGGVSGGSCSFGDSFAIPGCISHLNGTPSPLR